MSGVELLFVDGGATVTGLVSAGAAALGYGQRNRDAKELACEDELPNLRRCLLEAHASTEAGHRALTASWRDPLSLCGAQQETSARDRGVPDWAIEAVTFARRLVDDAAELVDLADVYNAQILFAEKEGAKGKGLMREPVLELICRLENLECQLTAHVSRIIQAREAFDSETPSRVEEPLAQSLKESLHPVVQGPAREMPIGILRDRGRLGEVYGSIVSVGQAFGDPLKRALARRGETYEEPAELSSYCEAYT
eukprot:TRINITY_DN62539_c0_g1_i1.p1 TRINITY_DN62539_c0_g1~~TRINITY_DN62539_c0_g1_i1.p1  ORF type:complete len:272 (+),score=44.11 TRINITY_DN62539_c0_g1_i1:59-817(+)